MPGMVPTQFKIFEIFPRRAFILPLFAPNRTSAVLAEAEEIVTTLSRPFQGRQVEEALFARQR
jgi:hypothetical protein